MWGLPNNFLQTAHCLGLIKCFEITTLIEIFENSTFFSIVILPPIKYCVTLCQFYSISSPFLLIKTKKIWNEKIFCMYGCFSISYIKEVKYHIFWYNHVLRCTCIYKQPILTKAVKWYFVANSIYIVISDTLIGPWMYFPCC